MPRQNRVTPFNEIIATAARGRFMGNRGVLHDAHGELRRPHESNRRWIFCRLEFKGRKRPINEPGRYTQLFFLDEATALAAGHRPCAECMRSRFNEFRDLWARANRDLAGGLRPLARRIDDALHEERLTPDRQKVTYPAPLDALPDGCLVRLEAGPDQAYLVYGKRLFLWSPGGYRQTLELPGDNLVAVLTPHSIVNALAAGYQPVLDSSVQLNP